MKKNKRQMKQFQAAKDRLQQTCSHPVTRDGVCTVCGKQISPKSQ